jgi:hypothetical protein
MDTHEAIGALERLRALRAGMPPAAARIADVLLAHPAEVSRSPRSLNERGRARAA